ncbi:hypothetical protein VNO77_27247 [Canavalia gladiata]|uniref:Uncharacterized protein n=1 Tax=Canavalia gladiata TaxID=3824 RepID=A0AAN9KVF5_CANGL
MFTRRLQQEDIFLSLLRGYKEKGVLRGFPEKQKRKNLVNPVIVNKVPHYSLPCGVLQSCVLVVVFFS